VRAFWWISVLAFLLLSGCEGAHYPLGQPTDATIDEQLIGPWELAYAPEGARDDDGKDSFLNIYAFNEHEYLVEGWDEGEEDDLMKLSAFATTVEGVLFAIVRCVNCDEDDRDEYFFFSYDLADDGALSVRAINDDLYDDLKDLGSIREVRRYVVRRLPEPDFFDDEVVVYRRGDVDS